jgi:hypothetical protein
VICGRLSACGANGGVFVFMRTVAIVAAVLLAGCAHEEAARQETRIVYRDRIKVVYACRPEPEGGCNSLKDRSACLAHKRCNWAEGDKVRGYCRRIFCRD